MTDDEEAARAYLARAVCRPLDDGTWWAEAEELGGNAWANGRTVREARERLVPVVHDWIRARRDRGLPLPPTKETPP